MLEAILLTMDICPNWYRDVALDTVENYYGNSKYHRSVSEKEFEWIKEVVDFVDAELDRRLKISKSWVTQQNWILETGVTSPADISLDTLVDHGKFLKFAFEKMGFENECDFIPDDLKGIEDTVAKVDGSLSSKDWRAKAKLYAMEYLKEDLDLTLDALVELISKRFNQEKIFTSHGGSEPIAKSSIKRILSTKGWFTQMKRKLAK